MGQSHVSTARAAALIATLLTIAAVPGQGPVYRERWTDMHLELLRERVLREAKGRDQAMLTKIAATLAEKDGGKPFRQTALALAQLRGVEPDDAFVLRATVGAFVLPEAVDPEASRDDCRALHVSVQVPYVIELPKSLEFEVEVIDAAGARVYRDRFGKDPSLEDLRFGRVTIAVPGGDLADGPYRVRVATIVDGVPARPTDHRLEHRVFVCRGYEKRAQSVRERAPAITVQLAPTQRAVVAGLVYEVERAWTGEAFEGDSDAVADLERAETALANIAADRPPLTGLKGTAVIGLPTGGETMLSAAVPMPTKDTPKRPLVVCIGGAPSLDVEGRRPMAPETRTARWTQRRLGDLGLGDIAHVVWLQSPGGGVQFAPSLPTALKALRDLLPTDGRTVLVLELEAAVSLCYAPDVLQSQASGVVLVGAGAIAKPVLERLGQLPILGVTLSGHRSSQGLEFTAALARGEHGALAGPTGFALAPAAARPWTFGAAAAEPAIAAFVRGLLAPK